MVFIQNYVDCLVHHCFASPAYILSSFENALYVKLKNAEASEFLLYFLHTRKSGAGRALENALKLGRVVVDMEDGKKIEIFLNQNPDSNDKVVVNFFINNQPHYLVPVLAVLPEELVKILRLQ